MINRTENIVKAVTTAGFRGACDSHPRSGIKHDCNIATIVDCGLYVIGIVEDSE